jgi:hypothetical protein
MLVRRLIHRERLSGNVIVEILNATNLVDLEIGWALSKNYFEVLTGFEVVTEWHGPGNT